jgi:hypothetical protein
MKFGTRHWVPTKRPYHSSTFRSNGIPSTATAIESAIAMARSAQILATTDSPSAAKLERLVFSPSRKTKGPPTGDPFVEK